MHSVWSQNVSKTEKFRCCRRFRLFRDWTHGRLASIFSLRKTHFCWRFGHFQLLRGYFYANLISSEKLFGARGSVSRISFVHFRAKGVISRIFFADTKSKIDPKMLTSWTKRVIFSEIRGHILKNTINAKKVCQTTASRLTPKSGRVSKNRVFGNSVTPAIDFWEGFGHKRWVIVDFRLTISIVSHEPRP